MLRFLASLMFLAWCSNAFAVCTADLTVCPSGCDYNVLNNAVTDLETNCASPSSPLTIEISGYWSSADTTAVGISGITTSATNTLTIYTTGSARTSGAYSESNGSYILKVITGGADVGINFINGFVTINGLQVNAGFKFGDKTIGTGGSLSGFPIIIIDSIIIGGRYTIRYDADVDNFYIINSIIYTSYASADGGCVLSNSASANTFIYSTTCTTPSGYGFRNLAGTMTIKNSYAKGGSGLAYGGTISQTTNASSDTTATGTALDNIAYNTTNFTNVTSGGEDLRLPAGSALIDVGTDTSGESAPLNFTTDITGTTRIGTWDIGADEYVSSGVTSVISVLGTGVYGNIIFN